MGGKNGKEMKKQPNAQNQQKVPNPEAQRHKKQKPPQQTENSWMYDLILQYLASPIWRNPISDFLDENCIVFDDEEENKIGYQDIHKKFKSMIEAMIEQLMVDIGVDDEEQLRGVIEMGLKNKRHKKYFEQLLIVDNFLVFKKLMLKRNKELEYEALKELQKQEGGDNPDVEYKIKQVEIDKERMEIEHAIAMSLAVDNEKKKMCIQEDEEFLEAIRQSQMIFQSEQQQQQQQQQQQAKPEQPKPQNQQPEAHVQQVESVLMFEDDMAEQEPSISKKPNVEVLLNQNLKKHEQEQQPQQQQQQQEELPQIKQELPQIKLRELPQIVQPKKEVSQAVKEREALLEQMQQLKKEKQEMDAQFEQEQKSKQQTESIDDRKKRLQEQRELIKKKKQQEREVEKQQYLNEDKPPQQSEADNKDKEKESLPLYNSEFIMDQQKAQQLQQKKEELKKRAELMKKIRQDAAEQVQQ